MNEIDLQKHSSNGDCHCAKCFYSDVMKKSGGSKEEVTKLLLKLQEQGIIEITNYDTEADPTDFKVINEGKLKEMLDEV